MGDSEGPAELDAVAQGYVRLVLAVGRHDPLFVDAYYGPPEWMKAAREGPPRALALLLAEARALLDGARRSPPCERSRFLVRQLVAVEGWLRREAGERISIEEEARLLFDIELPGHDPDEFDQARESLEQLVPGEGELGARIEAFRARFVVRPGRLDAVVRRSLEILRRRTAELVALPTDEAFQFEPVSGKSWGAYHWYQGGYRSRIELNTDLPSELGRLFDTLSHEGYPGHHVHNVLLEEALVRGKGWVELTVYPLYSPQSLIAEGVANTGMSILFSAEQKLECIARELSPLAGLAGEDVARYEAIREAARPLRNVRTEAARRLLGGADDEETACFIAQHGFESLERARRNVAFIRTYRAYIFTYTVGEDAVRAHIGLGPDRETRFFDLLTRAVTPSELKGVRPL